MNDIEVVPDLYRLAFIPGCFRCPQCDFRLTKTCIRADSGEIGTREQERNSEPCPNDGTMMVHVTYRETLEAWQQWEMERRDLKMKPSIGRIVHYRIPETNGIAAAIITAVWTDECVNLRIVSDGETMPWKTSVVRGDQQGQWSWPERV